MTLYDFDRELKNKSNAVILAGVDEAGRGPLAGPVIAAAVILSDKKITGLDDSKKLSSKKRLALFDIITKEALAFAIGASQNDEIDRYNILQATKMAMKRAINKLCITPDLIAIDAIKLSDLQISQIPIIKGDAQSASIAAASIIAKETRDAIMMRYHQEYPQYRFDLHKGYPTKLHLQMIRQYGACPIHRKTFRHVLDTKFIS